jgi:hypothetical protein
MKKFAPLFFLLTVWLSAQTSVQKETHGTINVIFANKNGAVVVTDSRLSNSAGLAGLGQKLFILDDRTVCAIAGFYDNSGAQFEKSPLTSKKLQPLDMSVPGIIQSYLDKVQASHTEESSVTQKLEDLTEVYTFTLQIAANMTSNPVDLNPPSPAILTVIGYQNGRLHVAGVKLQPYRVGRVLMYLPTDRIDRDLGDEFFNRIEGITNLADEIRKNPTEFLKVPLKKGFAEAITGGKGKDLDLEELEQIAEDLETETASRFSKFVGGPRQIAILKSGKLYKKGLDWPKPAGGGSEGLVTIDHLTMSHEGPNSSIFMKSAKGTVLFEAKLDHAFFRIDGEAFVSSDINASTLRYDGTLPTSLGKSNHVTNSRLLIGKGVSVDDPFLKHIHADFPDMVIIREKSE